MTSTTETPTDDAAEPGRKKMPKRGIRKRVLGDGEGDYCIYEIAPQGSQLPKGALLPIPEVPRFEETAHAIRWIKNQSGDRLTGKQVMVFKACEILSLQVTTQAVVKIASKPKTINYMPKGAETSSS